VGRRRVGWESVTLDFTEAVITLLRPSTRLN
jgi:hypothetical protein